MPSIPHFLCIDCGKPVKKSTAKRCGDCWAKARIAPRRFCVDCGNPVTKAHTKRCMDCYQKSFDDPEGFKECWACKMLKPLTSENFARAVSTKDGFSPICKLCKSQKAKEHYSKHKDLILQRNRDHRENNKEKFRVASRAKYIRTQEAVKARAKKWVDENREKHRAIQFKRRATKKGLPNNWNPHHWDRALVWWGDSCAYCGKPRDLWHALEADHFIPITSPLCSGSVPMNVLPACKSCNASKNAFDPAEWINRKFGKRKAAQILKRINAYFEWVKGQDGEG